jgi:hypothetical protein
MRIAVDAVGVMVHIVMGPLPPEPPALDPDMPEPPVPAVPP